MGNLGQSSKGLFSEGYVTFGRGTLALPDGNVATGGYTQWLERDVSPFQRQGFAEPQTGFKQDGGDMRERIFSRSQILLTLLWSENEVPHAFPGNHVDPWHPINDSPLLGKSQSASQRRQRSIDRAGLH